MRLAIMKAALLLCAVSYNAHAGGLFFFRGGDVPNASAPNGIALRVSAVNGGLPSGTGVGAIEVTTAGGGVFTGTLTMVTTGTDHAGATCDSNGSNFQTAVVNSNNVLKTAGALSSGSYPHLYPNVCIKASQGGNNYTQAFTITLNNPANTVTIRNWVTPVVVDRFHVAWKLDADGNKLDAHLGAVASYDAYPGEFFLIGTQYNCGFFTTAPVPPSPADCGVSVYTSTDLVTWHYRTQLITPDQATWPCGGNSIYAGCYTPRMVYNPNTGLYVLWRNDFFQPSGVDVLTCTTPLGPCTNAPQPTLLPHAADALALFVDDDGTGYLVYGSDMVGGAHISQLTVLNSSYTDSATGTLISLGTGHGGSQNEGQGMFKVGSTYYITSAALCAFCDGSADSWYWTTTASPPTSGWTLQSGSLAPAGSCAMQPSAAQPLKINGQQVILWQGDQWWQWPNGHANVGQQGFPDDEMFPLTFTGSTINPVTCGNPTIAGLTQETITPAANIDQSDFTDVFATDCQISSTQYRMQTFTTGGSTTSIPYIDLPLGMNNTACYYPQAAVCDPPNGNLAVSLVSLTGSPPVPNATLASHTYTPADLTWGVTKVRVPIAQSVSPSTAYGIVWQGTNTTGCFSLNYNVSAPYAGGIARYSTDSGSTWTTDAASYAFETYHQ